MLLLLVAVLPACGAAQTSLENSGRTARSSREKGDPMPTVQVRYIVRDVDAAIAFYRDQLGFREDMHPAPPFAMLSRGDLRLVLSAPNPAGGGGQPMPDGKQQEPGGWNRFALEVDDLESTVASLRRAGARFRNDIVTGVGGKQILLEDPSGNPIELFQPTREAARLGAGAPRAPH
jgi:catechol 2,3-dioxygenase-like lactoylglutathione lyase family enzyme